MLVSSFFNTIIMTTTITTFKEKASYPEQGIVMIFDLEGFSSFFSQPDVQDYVSKYLNIVLEAIEIVIDGGEAYWMDTDKTKLNKLPSHIHSKFLGDGGLYIWKYNDLTAAQRLALVNRLYNLKNNFDKIVKKAIDHVPVIDIPKNIRFGISAGSVYKLLSLKNNREEYIGYSINLASRLQGYCREVGFIVSGRLNVTTALLEEHGYKRQIAISIKGFPQEIVMVDKEDLDALGEEVRNSLFADIPT